MLSRFCLAFIFASLIQLVSAQAPQGINYQAVLRDSETGEAFRNQMVVIMITIRQGGPNGTPVYSETHSGIVTSEFGIINLQIGTGDLSEGEFSSIPWSAGDVWYEVEVDRGSGLESLGSSQFQSVPYALFAGNTESSLDNDPTNELISSAQYDSESNSILLQQADGSQVSISLVGLNVNDSDSDPTNELIVGAEYNESENQIEIEQADGSQVLIPLSAFNVEDGDADSTNELIETAQYNAETNSIIIQQADGSEITISLADLNVSDGDSDSTNELIDPDEGLQLVNNNLTITEAGQTYSVNLTSLIDDDDPIPTNELIDESSFVLIEDTILVISEAGIEHSVNLASLRNDDDWTVSADDQKVYNTIDKIGVGTSQPEAKFEVVETDESSAAMSVISGTDTLIHVQNKRFGIGTSNPSSTIQFNGSIGYDVTILSNEETDNYSAGIEDHMIVVTFQNAGNEDFSILLPSADVCEGRVYLIRKTGAPGAVGDVNIDTAGFPVDFDDPDLVLSENGPETTVLLSLGTNGWTRILRED
ncbi:MAG: hypothetical protein AAGC47_00565 [Bacteroidota bacterium]